MDRNRPLIGVSAYEVPASFSHWSDVSCVMIPSGYSQGVHAAGGVPLVVPPFEDNVELLDVLDGIVLSGGPDIGPDMYGQPAHPETTPVWPHRDAAELVLIRQVLEGRMPVLGICRGMQLLNVARGGDLVQHLADVLDDADLHKAAPGTFSRHPVTIEQGTLLASIEGAGSRTVHSCHHQAPGRIGNGLVVSARAADGVVEALEDPEGEFVLGVLWHPEEDGQDSALFRALVAAARAHRVARAA
jgi:putative glutamine amidotransferase